MTRSGSEPFLKSSATYLLKLEKDALLKALFG